MAEESISKLYGYKQQELSRMHTIAQEGHKSYQNKLLGSKTQEQAFIYTLLLESANELMNLILQRIEELEAYNEIEDPRKQPGQAA